MSDIEDGRVKPTPKEASQTERTQVHCPTCGRDVNKLQDYPLAAVVAVEILDLPEKIQIRYPKEKDLTDEVKSIAGREDVQRYLLELREAEKALVKTSDLLPSFKQSQYSKGLYSIPNTEYFLSFYESKDNEDTARVGLYAPGPNMGAAGGPTIMQVADLAEIKYHGVFLDGSGKDSTPIFHYIYGKDKNEIDIYPYRGKGKLDSRQEVK